MIGRNTATTILLCLFFALSIICRNGPDEVYFIGDAACWVIVCLILVLNLSGVQKIIAEGIFMLAISNLLDEIMFDPTHTGLNEWVFLFIVLIWSGKRIHKHARLRREERNDRVHY